MKKGIEWSYVSALPFLSSPPLKDQAKTRRLNQNKLDLLLNEADKYLRHTIILPIKTAMGRAELASIQLADIDLSLTEIH